MSRTPSAAAAEALTTRLRKIGIRVTGTPGAARAPNGLVPIASEDSDVLKAIVRRMDVDSLNFHAEVLGKLLARLTTGPPATIARGAAAIEAFERDQGVGQLRPVRQLRPVVREPRPDRRHRSPPVGGRSDDAGSRCSGWRCRAVARARSRIASAT